MIRERAMQWLAVSMLAATLSACGAREPAPIVIDFWAMGREGEAVQALIPEFERRHPGTRVRVQQIPWSAAHEKLLTAFAGDAMPDVFHLGNTWLAEFVALRAPASLNTWLVEPLDSTAQGFFTGLFETNVFDGHAYALPWYVDTRLLFYRHDVLAEAGFKDPPRTWAEWVTAMRRIQERTLPDHYAMFLPMNEWEPLVILALGLRAPLLIRDNRYGGFRDLRFRQAFEFYAGIFDRGHAPPLGSTQIANLYQDLARGRFAMFITGPWNIGELRRRLPAESFARWRTAPMPAPTAASESSIAKPPPGLPVPKGEEWPNASSEGPGMGVALPGVSLAGGASLVVARRSRHPEAAFRLVHFLCDSAQQLRFYRATGNLPARPQAWVAGDLRSDPLVAGFWDQMQRLRSTPAIPEWERIAASIERAAEAVVRREWTIDEAVTLLDAETDAFLEKRRWLMSHRHLPERRPKLESQHRDAGRQIGAEPSR